MKYTKYIILFLLLGCIEPIEFEIPPAESLLIIEGMINDEDGPYTVQISRAVPLSVDTLEVPPVSGASVRLHDDLGNVEDFDETEPGIYQTRGAMKGVVGRSYHITVSVDGKSYESTPEEIKPVGQISEIRYEFEEERIEDLFGEKNKDHFNIYVDAEQGVETGGYVRWRMTGTYKVETTPQLRETLHHPGAVPLKAPRPCSGYTTAVHPSGRGTIIVKVGECTCCECYVDMKESVPQVSDNLLVSEGSYNNVKIGRVPVNSATFMEKYMVRVEQMSLSRTAFDFFKLINIQKEQASNIFQPSSGELLGNIKALNSQDRVLGLFWATSITEKVTFIERDDVPYPVPDFPGANESCLLEFDYSTTEPPEEWN